MISKKSYLHSNYWLDYILNMRNLKKPKYREFTFQLLVRLYTNAQSGHLALYSQFTFQLLVRLYTINYKKHIIYIPIFTFQLLVRLYTTKSSWYCYIICLFTFQLLVRLYTKQYGIWFWRLFKIYIPTIG